MPTETERMLAGELYDPSASELVADRERARDLARRYSATSEAESAHRETLLRELFDAVGDDPAVNPSFRCDYGYNVAVGDDFFANFGCVFLDANRISFGDRCLLGPGVHVYTPTHPIDPEERATGRERAESVTVGDDVWIGGRAVLNPGVTVGDGAVIASGAVVTRDVPDRVVVGGNPARVIREIE
ncbi:sugar O-acetyltransferase [Halorubrum kocurii]|uniref:Transferase n=1 Tax=Halorubrum kocurii JCM 14978 TaxID=1230456 RepID=M0P9M7_9EURY|nr:sugar O-acetyltransferase [Halorubrum kocurii]EMA65505.1 transferase [Halorubrum kocurii JCM 14978]